MRYVLPATNSSLGKLLLYKDTFLYNVSQIGGGFKLRYWWSSNPQRLYPYNKVQLTLPFALYSLTFLFELQF